MKFNICYMGPETLFHLRRDFILVLKYGLEDLGHDVILNTGTLSGNRFNLLIGAYFLKPDQMTAINNSGVDFAHVNTEPIGNDSLNFNPKKVDFLGAYLPTMQKGKFVWDVIMDNIAEHTRYGTRSHFLRWGYHPKLEDIEKNKTKDLDFYFFGMMSDRRKKIVHELSKAGFVGAYDNSCPYFLRNDRIARAKIQLNLIQADHYTHVNSFRICYLANNSCCILSEDEIDPANYLQYADVVSAGDLVEKMRHMIVKNRWKIRGEKAMEDFSKQPMRDSLEQLLDSSFGSQN